MALINCSVLAAVKRAPGPQPRQPATDKEGRESKPHPISQVEVLGAEVMAPRLSPEGWTPVLGRGGGSPLPWWHNMRTVWWLWQRPFATTVQPLPLLAAVQQACLTRPNPAVTKVRRLSLAGADYSLLGVCASQHRALIHPKPLCRHASD